MDLSFLNNIYEQKLLANERNINFWEHYLKNLEALDFNVYTEKLSVPILVPIGSKILFRGKVKHTNEVTVALGNDYFTKCSVQQAEILRQHRIQDAKSKLKQFEIEREHLQNQLSFSKQSLPDVAGHEIIEQITEEEDKAWREKHRENVRKYKQRKDKSDELSKMSDKELGDILDELELQEDLENEIELQSNSKQTNETEKHIDPEAAEPKKKCQETAEASNKIDSDDDAKPIPGPSKKKVKKKRDRKKEKRLQAEYLRKLNIFLQPSKFELFENVVDRHNTVKEMVNELRARTREGVAEYDVERRLDEMELEALEDEIAMLEDVCSTDYDDYIEVPEDEADSDDDRKRAVAFADTYDNKTFEITFRHSEVRPSDVPYDPKNGIKKPSDIYKACSSDFTRQTTSILKKPKSVDTSEESGSTTIVNENHKVHEDEANQKTPEESGSTTIDSEYHEIHENEVNQNPNSNTVVVRDVVEKVECNDNCVKSNERPMSLFKKRRQLQKE